MQESSEWLHGPHLGGVGPTQKDRQIEETLRFLRSKAKESGGVRDLLDELILFLQYIVNHSDYMHVYSAIVIRLGLTETLMELRRNSLGRKSPNENLIYIQTEVNQKVAIILDALKSTERT